MMALWVNWVGKITCNDDYVNDITLKKAGLRLRARLRLRRKYYGRSNLVPDRLGVVYKKPSEPSIAGPGPTVVHVTMQQGTPPGEDNLP